MIGRFEELLLFPISLVLISELYLKARDCTEAVWVGMVGMENSLFSYYFSFYFYYIEINIYNNNILYFNNLIKSYYIFPYSSYQKYDYTNPILIPLRACRTKTLKNCPIVILI